MPNKVCVYVSGKMCLIIGAFMKRRKMNMKTSDLRYHLIKISRPDSDFFRMLIVPPNLAFLLTYKLNILAAALTLKAEAYYRCFSFAVAEFLWVKLFMEKNKFSNSRIPIFQGLLPLGMFFYFLHVTILFLYSPY